MVEKKVRIICGEPPRVDPERIVLAPGETLTLQCDPPGARVFIPVGPTIFKDGEMVPEMKDGEVSMTLRSAQDIKAELGKFVNERGELECPCSTYCPESNTMVASKAERGSAPVIIIKTD